MPRTAKTLMGLAMAALLTAGLASGPVSAGSTAVTIETDIAKLPERVRAMYTSILEAARSGDMEEMRSVLEANELMPQVSFGGADDPIAYWKETSGDKAGREILAVLVNVLSMPYVHTAKGTDNEIYVWPYLSQADLAKLTPEQEVDLYRLVKPVEAKAMREFGGYIWYRLGIGPDGTWHFFVAGD